MLRLYDTLASRPEPDQELYRAISSVRFRWRSKVALRGLAIVLGAAMLIFLVSTLGMDKFRFTPTSVLVFRIATYVLVLGALVRFLVLPLAKGVSDRRVALYIEEREPSLQAALISAVDFKDAPKTGDTRISPALTEKLVQSAADRCREIEFGHDIDQRALRRSGGALAGVAAVGMLLLITNPAFMRHGAPFLLFPWSGSTAENPYAIEVLPGDTLLARGADLRVNARLAGFDADEVTIAVKRGENGEWERWTMTVGAEAGAYEVFIFDLDEPTDYSVEASGVRTPVFHIDVADLPYVERVDLEYRFPSYTGLRPEILEDRGDIAALRGTRVVVTITSTLPVSRGMLVVDGADSTEMTVAEDGKLSGTLTVEREGLYRVLLAGFDGRMVVASPDYFIDALDDQPPVIRIEQPGRDIKVTPIEEALVEVSARDDYGLRTLRLIYSVNGGPEDTIPLYDGARPAKDMSATHTFYLEELSLEPGDLVSYYAQVADNNRVGGGQTVTTDIYFMDVRPFGRDYRQAEQGGGGGGGGGGGDGLDGQFSQQQRQIVAATFKMDRDRDEYSDKEFQENMATLALTQGRLRERVEAVVRRIQDRGVMQADSGFAKIMEELPAAAEEMVGSEEALGERDPEGALPPAQRALQHLQRAEAAFREVQVSMGGGGGGGGGGQSPNAEDLADLFELELDKMQNQYESVQRGQQEQTDQELDAALQKLQELARRQQQENERMRRRAANLQNQVGGGGQGQRQLAREAEELARQLERLSREQSLDGLMDSARRLQEAADAMRRAASEGSGDLSEARSALDRLQEARRMLERGQSERLERDVQDALRRAQRLEEQQGEMTEDVERMGRGGQRSAEAMQRIMERKDQMAEQVSELEADLDEMAREWRQEQSEAARALGEAAGSIRDNRLPDKIRYSKGVVQQRTSEYARNFEESIGGDMEELRQLIERAAGAIAEDDEQRIGELLEDTRGLVRDLESLDERIQERAEGDQQQGQQQGGQQQGGQQQGGQQQGGQQQGGQQQGGQQQGGQQQGGQQRGGQQQGGQQQGGQQQGGQQQGGRGDGGRLDAGRNPDRVGDTYPRGPAGGGWGGFRTDDIRQFRGEFRQRAEDLEALRQRMAREGIDVSELANVLARLRELESRDVYDDPAEIARLQRAAIETLKEFEYRLRREFQGADAERLLLSGSDEVPEGFKELVEEYYRALSNRRR